MQSTSQPLCGCLSNDHRAGCPWFRPWPVSVLLAEGARRGLTALAG